MSLALGISSLRAADRELSLELYASPDGSGNGRSLKSPARLAKLWDSVKPGTTIWLLDGRYVGADSMVVPPGSVGGTRDAPVRLRARSEGKVLIDGEKKRPPVLLRDNAFVSIEGIDACCSSMDVVYLSGTRGVAVKRVVAWDAAPDQNAMIFSVAYGSDTLLEDTAGFGSARKIYQYFRTDGPATIRRAWAEWNWSVNKGPKMAISLVYDSRNLTVENAIGTWHSLMPERYVVMNNGKPFAAGVWSDYTRSKTSCSPGEPQPDGTCLVTGGAIDQMYGIFGADALGRDKRNRRANSRILGSLAYVAPGVDASRLPRLFFLTQLQSVTLQNDVGYWPEQTDKPAFLLADCTAKGPDAPCEASDHRLLASRLTAFGGAMKVSAAPKGHWETSAIEQLPDRDSRGGEQPSVFSPEDRRGASLCYRYVDGALTKDPLWPWPMNGRIAEAMRKAEREPIDVTKTVEQLLGPIPEACRMPKTASAAPATR